MRSAIVLAVLAFFFAFVGAVPAGGNNARRMAAGLNPLPPVRRSPTPVDLAARHKPSDAPNCNTGAIRCCRSVASSNDGVVKLLMGMLHIPLPAVAQTVGLGCSVFGVGLGGNSCSQQPVCCQNNNYNGVIAIGCTPININP